MPPKKPAETTDPRSWKTTSLRVDPAVYRRAWNYKLDKEKDLGEIVTEALDEFLKKRGA